jgi:hypothetical protein
MQIDKIEILKNHKLTVLSAAIWVAFYIVVFVVAGDG